MPDRVSIPAKLFLIAAIVNGFGNGVFGVILQLYLISLGFNSVAIGTMFMMNSLGSALLTLPAGIFADRYGRSRVLLFGFSLEAVGWMILLTSKNIEMLSFSFMLLGLTNAVVVVLPPLYSSFFDREDMDRAFGLFGFLNIAALSMGSLFGFVPQILVASHNFSLQYAYWTVLVVAVAFLILSMILFIMSAWGVTEPSHQGGFKFNLKSKSVVAKFSFLSVVNNICFGVFFGLFPYYVNKKFGVESSGLSALFFVSRLITAGVNALAPSVSKKVGTHKAIVAALSLSTPFYLIIPFAPNFTWLSAFYILRIGIANISPPLANSLTMKLLREEEKATANSIIMMAGMGSGTVGPWLGGQLMEQVSLDFPAYLGFGLFVAYTASFYFLLRKEVRPEHI